MLSVHCPATRDLVLAAAGGDALLDDARRARRRGPVGGAAAGGGAAGPARQAAAVGCQQRASPRRPVPRAVSACTFLSADDRCKHAKLRQWAASSERHATSIFLELLSAQRQLNEDTAVARIGVRLPATLRYTAMTLAAFASTAALRVNVAITGRAAGHTSLSHTSIRWSLEPGYLQSQPQNMNMVRQPVPKESLCDCSSTLPAGTRQQWRNQLHGRTACAKEMSFS